MAKKKKLKKVTLKKRDETNPHHKKELTIGEKRWKELNS